MSHDHHSYDAVMQAGAAQHQQEQQSFRNAASLAQKYGIELGPELTDELASPTQYDQPQDDGYAPSFYESEMWMDIKPQGQAKPVDTRPQQEIDYENYLAQKQQAQQPQEQAEQVQGQNAKLVASSLEYGWETPSFQAYLDSDDESYQQVQLSPQQIQLASEMWGLDEDTAKAYVYHHRLSAEDIALIEMSFTGKRTPKPQLPTDLRDEYVNQQLSQHQQGQQQVSGLEDDDYDVEDTSNAPSPEIDPAQNYVSMQQQLDWVRSQYFNTATDSEWSQVLNMVLNEFQALPPQQQAQFDDAVGFYRLYQQVNGRRKQGQQYRQQHQRVKQGASKAQALTAQGKLKQSWINSLSNVDYAKQADLIMGWYARGLVDRNA